MTAAYNLWGFLNYDLGCSNPPDEIWKAAASLNFEQRIYQSLKRKGLAPKFECAGIYAILLDGKIVYIGKSVNILARMA